MSTSAKKSVSDDSTLDSAFHCFAIVRRLDGVYALGFRRRHDFVLPKPPSKNDKAKVPEDDSPIFDEQLVSLAPGSTGPTWSGSASFLELHLAWELLASVRELNAEVQAAVQHILATSIIDPAGDKPGLPPLLVDSPPPPHRATAANPRAYTGTKNRPPKTRRAEPIDLRPFLCTYEGSDRVVASLADAGLHIESLDDFRKTPAGFRRYFSFGLRCGSMRTNSEVLGLYWQLALDHDSKLRRLLGRLSLFDEFAAWLSAISELPAERRLCVVDLLDGRDEILGAAPASGVLREIDSLCEGPYYRHRLYYFLRMLSTGVEMSDVAAGFQLANDYFPEKDFRERPASAECADPIRAFMSDVRMSEHEESWKRTGFALWLWDACAERPELAEVLRSIPWTEMSQSAAIELARQLAFFSEHDVYEKDEAWRWCEMREVLDEFVEGILKLAPEYQKKAVDLFGEGVWDDMLKRGEMKAGLRFLLKCADRVCHAPFEALNYGYLPLQRLSLLDVHSRRAVLNAPEASFRVLDKNCKRENNARLICWGFVRISDQLPELFINSFATCPGSLIRAAKTLAALSVPDRRVVLKELQENPLSIDPAKLTAHQLVERLDARLHRNATNPVPARLRKHLEGSEPLKPNQLERHAQKIRESWNGVLCDEIRESALELLRERVGIDRTNMDSEAVRHALMMHASVDEQRRSLRRLLVATVNEDHDPIRSHPANQHWLARHTKIDAQAWTTGIELERKLDEETITLSIERNPLEALRLGTLVGSCLGVGGSFTYSAAAIVLDINKQVIFARNPSGHFLARQVIAITESETLACFEVYPLSTPAPILRLFAEYDRALAAALNLNIYSQESDPEDEFGDIANTVSTDWWDDSTWNLKKRSGSKR